MRTVIRFVLALSFVALSFATAPLSAQTAADRPFVRLSYVPGTQALPVIVGIERGFFAREGIAVSMVGVVDQNAIVNSLTLGATDIALGPQSWLLDMAHGKVAAKVIALDGYRREIELIVPAWDTTTKDIADLKGKTILFVGGTHNFDLIPELYRILAFSKMRLADIKFDFFQLNQFGQLLDPKTRQAWQQRKVGAIFAAREYTDRHVKDKRARAVMGDEQITTLIGRLGPRPVFANADFVKNRPITAQRFVTAWVKTLDYIHNQKQDSAQLLAYYFARQYGLPLKKEDAELYVSLIKYDRAAWTENDIKEININGQAISAARNLLFASIKDPAKRPFQTAPDVTGYFDDSFVKKAVAALEDEKKKRAAAPPPAPATPAPAAPKSAEPEKKPEGEKKAEGEEKPKSN
jgi:ABC-type nitrate/sulfonate/bicarbonate transport system substrate-binding protein